MLAVIYLIVATLLGDRIRRLFWRAHSTIHRAASAFLVGILVSSWVTYLLAVIFAWTAHPLIWANLLYFATAIVLLVVFRKKNGGYSDWKSFNRSDAVFLAAFCVIASWLMFGTIRMQAGDVRLSSVVWNDFGPNLALMQSFALGHNFPAQYPYFIGEPIRYHFLFWFEAGNLEFLGLKLAPALNLLSLLSTVALLLSITALGEALFGSPVVGGIGALLIFFQGSLSWIPFLESQRSIGDAIHSILHLDHWLKSGFPYKGEDWGIWSPSILYVQRHLLGAMGVLCLVLVFLVDFYRRKAGDNRAARDAGILINDENESNERRTAEDLPFVGSFVFSGALIGLLVFWNSAVFLGSLAVLGCTFLLLPGRRQIIALVGTAVVIGLPQIFLLGLGDTTQRLSIFHWGFTVDNPTLLRVGSYFLFTFGPKFVLAIVAVFFVGKIPRVLFAAMFSLVAIAFCTQLNVEIMNNQKFLYVWLMLLNLFVAWALVRTWRLRIVGKPAATVLVVILIASGAIDFFRVHNDTWVDVPFRNNSLSKWLLQKTKPSDVFLTERFVHHPILMNGRRIFYGWPYFPWSMGYRTAERDQVYKEMFTEKNPEKLLNLLRRNGINYVAIDDGVRNSFLQVRTHENVFASHLPQVFQDTEKRFGNLTIYEVPK